MKNNSSSGRPISSARWDHQHPIASGIVADAAQGGLQQQVPPLSQFQEPLFVQNLVQEARADASRVAQMLDSFWQQQDPTAAPPPYAASQHQHQHQRQRPLLQPPYDDEYIERTLL